MKEKTANRSAADVVADRIIEIIDSSDSSELIWRKPWTPPPGPTMTTNGVSGSRYAGLNAFSGILTTLSIEYNKGDHFAPVFATINQWIKEGERTGLNLFPKQWVKGEKNSKKDVPTMMITIPIFEDKEDKKEKKDEKLIAVMNEKGLSFTNDDSKRVMVSAKLGFVVHYSDVNDGMEWFEQKYGKLPAPAWDIDIVYPILKKQLQDNMGVLVTEKKTDKAFYVEGRNEIIIPTLGQFPDAGQFYGTLLHEAVHSTESEDSVLQDFLKKNYPDKTYGSSIEVRGFLELRAEIGALLLSRRLGVPISESDMASYVNCWDTLAFAKENRKMIAKAANSAQGAVNLICTDDLMQTIEQARQQNVTCMSDSESNVVTNGYQPDFS